MKIKIRGTGEIKELKIRDRRTGCEYTATLVEDDDCITYNRALEVYETDQASYDWWDSMLEQIEHAEDIKELYIERYGADAVEETLAQYDTPTDLEDQPAAMIAALEDAFGSLDEK
ncbi:hypothetical protein [Pyramidobacter piscolens]|uniref:hypothetical protein n=1 Tax=Pyramidobacter piscolens TaxID=638849 RepID=UPI002AB2EBF6|nr:hypothetical protein [Pyramidobacter piscolens]